MDKITATTWQTAWLPLFVISLLSGCRSDNNQFENPFPDKAQRQVVIKEDDGTGSFRFVDYAADGYTPVRERLVLPDGSERRFEYSPDFTILRESTYFPPKREGGALELEREITYAPDGKSYLSHTDFNRDGKRKSDGWRDQSGRYQIRYYREDGKTVKTMTVAAENGQLERSQEFNLDGNLASITEYEYSRFSESRTTTHFDATQTAVYQTSISTGSLSDEKIEVFFPGSKIVRLKVLRREAFGEITLFNQNGEELRRWSVSEKKLDVQVFEPGTNNYGPTYSQFFIRVPSPDNPDLASYELDAIREFDYQRIPLDLYGYREKHIARLIEFDPGEDNPAFMVIGEAFSYTDEKTVQYLNRDGMVIKEEKHSDDRKVPPVISEINPPRAPEKALVSSRFGYQPFDLPDYIDFPEIEITGPGAVK